MTELTDAEFIENEIRNNINARAELKLKEPSDWIIEQIETLLNSYPILRQFNYKKMNLEDLLALVESLSEFLEMEYIEDEDIIHADLTEMLTLFSLQELILWITLALLKNKSHIHFKFSEKLFHDTKISENNAIDYLCDNSYHMSVSSQKELHFTLSVVSIFSFDYNNEDSILTSLKSIQKLHKKDLSLLEYIAYRKTGQNIDINPKLQNQSKRIKIKI
jgi:hypothetical protein